MPPIVYPSLPTAATPPSLRESPLSLSHPHTSTEVVGQKNVMRGVGVPAPSFFSLRLVPSALDDFLLAWLNLYFPSRVFRRASLPSSVSLLGFSECARPFFLSLCTCAVLVTHLLSFPHSVRVEGCACDCVCDRKGDGCGLFLSSLVSEHPAASLLADSPWLAPLPPSHLLSRRSFSSTPSLERITP